MYLLILFFPILNLVISCLFGRFLGRFLSRLLILNMVFATVVSFFIFYEVGLAGYTCFVNLGS
jgi:hypothetical protein